MSSRIPHDQFSQRPPVLKELLAKKYLAIHEAVFVLTEWPKESFQIFYEASRPLVNLKCWCKFYMPKGDSAFDPTQFGTKFENIFSKIKKSAEKGTLDAEFSYLHDGITWIFKANHVLYWALDQGLFFSENLQKEFDTYLIEGSSGKLAENWVKKKIITQFLLYEHPTCPTNKLKEDSLFAAFQIKSVDKNCTAIVHAIESVRDKPGKKGKRTRDLYIPKAIPEIKQTDLNGTVRYHVPSLKVGLTIMMWAWVFRKGNNNILDGMHHCIKTSQYPVSDWYLSDAMAQLYLRNSPPALMMVAMEHCSTIWDSLIQYCQDLES